MRIGVIGYRSWIAEHLMTELLENPSNFVVCYEKQTVGTTDFSHLDCLFVFAGRARPTEQEMADERDMLSRFVSNGNQCRKTIYLSSMSIFGATPYGMHKRMCESILSDSNGPNIIMLRAAAVFGPGQSINSTMLIPTIARNGTTVELKNPNRPTQFISIFSLVEHLVFLSDNYDIHHMGMPHSRCEILGTFTLTPEQVLDMWMTFENYRITSAASQGSSGNIK